MIIREKCFETNSSSTHALCIGRNKSFKDTFSLITKFKNNINNWYNFEDEMDYESKLLKSMNDNDYITLLPTKSSKCKLKLKRYKDVGRIYFKYESFDSKIAFVWTSLLGHYQYHPEDEKYVIKFLSYFLKKWNIGLELVDLQYKYKKIDGGYNKPKTLVELGENLKKILNLDSNKNIYFYGEESYGYYPIEDLKPIIDDENLFANLIFGDSKIYTGSDEWPSFEDLNFDNYKFKIVGGSDYGYGFKTNIFNHLDDYIGIYNNGNYTVKIFYDGTKIKELNDPKFFKYSEFNTELFKKSEIEYMKPNFPDSIDLKITDFCNNNCEYCYENSGPNGKEADFKYLKNLFTHQIRPYTEVAIGGGNPISYSHIIELLECAKDNNVICNMTLKDADIIKPENIKLLEEIRDKQLIYGLGISPTNPELLVKAYNLCPLWHKIVHLILGIHGADYLEEIKTITDKILFLGFKNMGRAIDIEINHKKIEEIKYMLDNYLFPEEFEVISFDNLAIEQLKVDKHKFKEVYQGEDGLFSCYVDGVNQKIYPSSTTINKDYSDNGKLSLNESFRKIRKDVMKGDKRDDS